MQTELPKTGHVWIDVAVYVAIGLVTFFKGIAFLRDKGIIAPAPVKPSTNPKEQTQMMRVRGSGMNGDRSVELWDYKIAEIIEKQLNPCKELLEEQSRQIAANRDQINRILSIMENINRSRLGG